LKTPKKTQKFICISKKNAIFATENLLSNVKQAYEEAENRR
jgi:hypothetical protein